MSQSNQPKASTCLHYQDDILHLEALNLAEAAQTYGTPTYLYSKNQLLENWQRFSTALNDTNSLICYAVKANSNIHLLRLLANQGAGFDIVSGGELEQVLKAGANPNKIIFSGVGKSTAELQRAIDVGIHCINVESESELRRIHELSQHANHKINIALRVNPNINPHTHHYIATGLKENKFGIDIAAIPALCQTILTLPQLQLIGLACHIGSQITDLEPFLLAADRMLALYQELQPLALPLQHLDLGGGLGISYHHEANISIETYINALLQKLKPYSLQLILEPGRSIVANTGILLTKIEYIKQTANKHFAIVDAGMTENLRPALYQAWHQILPVRKRTLPALSYDIAGPVCESADILGKDRLLRVEEGDVLVMTDCGAYGFSMASNYNMRLKPAEILVANANATVIRHRESYADLFALESID